MGAAQRPTVLVTGASGIVGSALLRELDGEYDLIGLVHSGTLAVDGAEAVRSDVSAPLLGLSEADYRDLAARTDVIVHSAGLTDFSAPAARHQSINVVGTERVLELAIAAGAPIHHISTSFVQALDDDAPLELETTNSIYAYVSSKATAEQLVVDSGVEHTMFRPSNLIGDSRTGKVGAGQFVAQLTLEALRGRLPLLPARPDARLDMVPEDVCAQAIAAVLRAGELGGVYWLTYGADSPSIPDLIELGAVYMTSIGQAIVLPTVVDPNKPELMAAELERLPRRQRGLFPWLVELSAAMTAGGTFPTSLPDLRDRYGVPIPDLPETLRRGLAFLLRAEGVLEPAA